MVRWIRLCHERCIAEPVGYAAALLGRRTRSAWRIDTDTHANTDTHTHTDTSPDADANTDASSDANTDTDTSANSYADTDTTRHLPDTDVWWLIYRYFGECLYPYQQGSRGGKRLPDTGRLWHFGHGLLPQYCIRPRCRDR